MILRHLLDNENLIYIMMASHLIFNVPISYHYVKKNTLLYSSNAAVVSF